MIAKFIILVFISQCYLELVGVAQGPMPPQPGPRVAWTEHYRKATFSFGTVESVNGARTYNPIGTGVAVCTDPQHAFIVTAKHVFSEPSKQWSPGQLSIRFSSQERSSMTQELGTAISLKDEKGAFRWSSLDDNSDIAALRMPDVLRGKLTDCIGFPDFATDDDVYDGAVVFTFGFPVDGGVIAGSNALVRAITRSGIIAWTDPNGALDNPLILDSTILPGNSGGPAFKVPVGPGKSGGFEVSQRVAFLGIVTTGLEATVQVGDQPLMVQRPGSLQPDRAGVIGVGALGRVEPASKVRKLVNEVASH